MCIYCEPVKRYGGKELTKQISKESIDMGDYLDVLQLEAWMMSDEEGNKPKLQFCLSVSSNGDDIKSINLPIKYCPFCGREL